MKAWERLPVQTAIPNKIRDILIQETGNFEFIGPDSGPVIIETAEQFIRIADIISGKNKANY